MSKVARICEVDFDEATFVGDDHDGVYFQVAEAPKSKKWYMSAVVDCTTAHFTDAIATDSGPFPTEEAAMKAGHNLAVDWCVENRVDYGQDTCNLALTPMEHRYLTELLTHWKESKDTMNHKLLGQIKSKLEDCTPDD